MICPICKENETYSKKRIIKDGYFNGKYFVQTGTKEVEDNWWTCKHCTKVVNTNHYTNIMINYFNSLEENELDYTEKQHLKSIINEQ